MLNLGLVAKRFGQYGAAWAGAFLLVLLGDLALTVARVPFAKACDPLLLIALIAVSVGFALFVALTWASRESTPTKVVLLAAGVVLLFPLLWAPMLGAVAAAYLVKASVEYSAVYAGFRIIIGRMIFMGMRLFSDNPYVEAGLSVLNVLATVVGFIASLAQLWRMFVAPPQKQKRAAEG